MQSRESVMRQLQEFRTGKPGFYPDQTIYAEYACAEFGLAFDPIDGETGLLFNVASPRGQVWFGAGRCSWYPQNSATASSLATDKYFANAILERAGIPTLGGEYFFLHDRHRAHRPQGRERGDALAHFGKLNGAAFVKPLTGARGDFAEAVYDEASLCAYLDQVARHYDAVLMQPVFFGREYRIFLLDDEVVYSARKYPPDVVGDGVRTLRDLVAEHGVRLREHGVSTATLTPDRGDGADTVLAKGQRWTIPGRTNLSAGGTMALEVPSAERAAFALAQQARRALGLRVAAIDLFTDVGGDPAAIRLIEVNSNPSIRFLEQCERPDLILKIWHHTFSAMGLLGV